MNIEHRWRLIMDEIHSSGTATIRSVMALTGASVATVRRDFTEMMALGLVRRKRGGVVRGERAAGRTGLEPTPYATPLRPVPDIVPSPAPAWPNMFGARMNENAVAKRAIAKIALEYMTPDAPVIIDGGTTTFHMASMLDDRAYTVLTASLPVFRSLVDHPNIRVTLAGGELFREQMVMLSPYDEGILRRFEAARMFVGGQALGPGGLMQRDVIRVQSQRQLIERARELIVLADSTKINALGAVSVCALDEIDVLITDDGIDAHALKWLMLSGIEVRIARINERPVLPTSQVLVGDRARRRLA